MLKVVFSKVCFVTGIVLLGACTEQASVPPTPQEVLKLSLKNLNKRYEDLTRQKSEMTSSAFSLEGGAIGGDEPERVGFADILAYIEWYDGFQEKVRADIAEIREAAGDSFGPQHDRALQPCRDYFSQINNLPADPAQLAQSLDSKIVQALEIIAKTAESVYEEIDLIDPERLSAADLDKFTKTLAEYEARIAAALPETTKQKSSFSKLSSRLILAKYNHDLCSGLIESMDRREGVFSNLTPPL